MFYFIVIPLKAELLKLHPHSVHSETLLQSCGAGL